MADGIARPARKEPLPERRVRVMRRMEVERAEIGEEWHAVEAAIERGERRSAAAFKAVLLGARWSLLLAGALMLSRRRGRISWRRMAFVAAVARAVGKHLLRRYFRGERNVVH
jgi:hypothetical protein